MQKTKSRARVGTPDPDSLAANMLNPYNMVVGGRNVVVQKKQGGMHGAWKSFDSKFMKPLFGGAGPDLHRHKAQGLVSNNMDDLRGGDALNIGSSGNFESTESVDPELRSLVSSDGDDSQKDGEPYTPPGKDSFEDPSNAIYKGALL